MLSASARVPELVEREAGAVAVGLVAVNRSSVVAAVVDHLPHVRDYLVREAVEKGAVACNVDVVLSLSDRETLWSLSKRTSAVQAPTVAFCTLIPTYMLTASFIA